MLVPEREHEKRDLPRAFLLSSHGPYKMDAQSLRGKKKKGRKDPNRGPEFGVCWSRHERTKEGEKGEKLLFQSRRCGILQPEKSVKLVRLAVCSQLACGSK